MTIDLVPGDRVEIAAWTNCWRTGDCFGQVLRIGRKWIAVQMDRSGRTRKFPHDLLIAL